MKSFRLPEMLLVLSYKLLIMKKLYVTTAIFILTITTSFGQDFDKEIQFDGKSKLLDILEKCMIKMIV